MQRGWNFLRPERKESFDILPASQRLTDTMWYAGTADAVYQNIDIIRSYRPQYIVILAGDHIYKMDYELMLQQHVQRGADVTVGCIDVPRKEASGFGVMDVDETDRIVSFLEKPQDPPGMPSNPEMSLASMGIYVFETRFLFDQLRRDAALAGSNRDFGKDIIPHLVRQGNAVAHRFSDSCVRTTPDAEAYWRDVGTVDAYWQANIDLTDPVPSLDLYDRDWPIWTFAEVTPPAKFVGDGNGNQGLAENSLVAGGCIVSGARIRRSLLFTGVRVDGRATVENSVVLPEVKIGAGAFVNNAVVDRGVRIPEKFVIGEDPEADARRFRRTENGICLVTQPMLDRLTNR
jgi:glucose-1-phosphate adenylyltransferase